MIELVHTNDAKNLSIEELYQKLETSKKGLTAQESTRRLEHFGPNEIEEKKVNPLLKLLTYFWGPIPWMIEIAAVLSIATHQMEDFWIIFIMLMVNSVVGFWQEHKADNAIELLKQKLALQADVWRDGKLIEVPAREIVPGDIVRVRLGQILPADIKLCEGDYLSVDESVLTGESLPVDKKLSDIAYGGAIIRQGEMNGIVVGTGKNSFFGRTTSLMEEAKNVSHFQKAIVKIGNYLIILAIVLVGIVFIVGIIRGDESFVSMLQFALILIVAAIPVALPAVLMVSMAIGASELAKRDTIARKLVSIEEMASMDILCSDKTGTITKNEISIADIIPYGNYSEKDVLYYGVLASKEENRDAIDNAFLTKYREFGTIEDIFKDNQVTKFIPFDPIVKRTEAHLIDNTSKVYKASKGALQVIVNLLKDQEKVSEVVSGRCDDLASCGYRTLAIARTIIDSIWDFVGIVALHDPPREDSADTIKAARRMGVDVKMVTGDHIAIAKEVSKSLEIGTDIVAIGSILDKNDANTIHHVERANGFAQVYPEHKFHIIELLQKANHIVGMTGDGVNDAPALKQADVGIAVDNATDAAKSAAAMVLTKPGLSVIIDGIRESRIIFHRMKSYATYRIAETVRVLIFLVLSILIFRFYPITAVMIVILALLNDLPIMTIAFDTSPVSEKPVRWDMRAVIYTATILGLSGVVFSFGLLLIGMFVFKLPSEVLQTLIFLKLTVAGHMTIYLARTDDKHFWVHPLPAKILFFVCEFTQLGGTAIAAYGIGGGIMTGIGWGLAGFVWLYALFEIVVVDWIKVGALRLTNFYK